MKIRSALMVSLATPLVLVDLGLLAFAWIFLATGLVVAARAFPSYWPLIFMVAIPTVVYLAGLYFVAADAFQDGLRQFRTPQGLLRCSLLGLAMNSAGALLAIVIWLALLVFPGSIF